MNKVKQFFKDKWFYIVSLLLPWVVALVHSFLADTWVTGNGNIATGDLQGQIIPICYEFWDKMHSGESMAYTWHILGGLDFGALMGYLASPFTYIMLLFPRHCIPDFIQFTMLAKWSLCAFTMTYFFYHTKHNTLQKYKKGVSLFLGLAYALSNGVLSYIIYIQFMDALIVFPILLLLVEKLVDEKKWKLYYLVLTFCMYTNSYIAFEICIFLVIWFVMQFHGDTVDKFKKFLLFAGVSCLSALTCMGGIVGGLNLAEDRLVDQAASSQGGYVTSILISPTEFLKQFFTFSPIELASSRTPNIYFTIMAVFLALLFVFIKIGKKRKLYMCAVSLMFVASFFVGGLNLVWHIFNIPNGLYNRFMYLFIFYTLFMALYVLEHLRDIHMKEVIVVAVLMVAAAAYAFFTIGQYDSTLIYISTALILGFYIVVMIFYAKGSIEYDKMLLVIALFGLMETAANAYNAFGMYDQPLIYGKGSYTEKACKLLEQAELEKGERIVATAPTSNIGLITGQDADSGFISSMNMANKRLHEKLGASGNSRVEYSSRGATPLVNLIFNLRYHLCESDMVVSDAEKVAEDENLQLYRTNRLAGLGYMVDDSIQEWNDKDKNAFQYQNDFVRKAVQGDDIFKPVKADISCGNFFGKEYDPEKKLAKNGTYSYWIKNEFGNEYDSIQLTYIAGEDVDLYMNMWSENNYTIQIFIDGELKHEDIRSFMQNTYHIGEVKKGQRVAVCAVPYEDFVVNSETNIMFTFAGFNEENYAKVYEKLSESTLKLETEEPDYLKGTIDVKKDGIMMTSIQAVDAFHVYVDGKETSYKTIGNALIGVPMTKGTHTVEVRYGSTGISWGTGLKYGCIVFYLLLCVISYVQYRKKKQVAVSEE